MAVRFAVATGNWSNNAIWDNGLEPTSADDVYANGLSITIDKDVNVASLRNTTTPVITPNIATPVMTSVNAPSGLVFANVGYIDNAQFSPWRAFNQDNDNTKGFNSGVIRNGTLGYTFTSQKIIKRYVIKNYFSGTGWNAKTWFFEGSNDNFSTSTQLDYIASYTTNATFTSSIINPSNLPFLSYRIRVTDTQTGDTVIISEFEMTESSGQTGGNGGGSFTVPASLSGTRNIVQSGDGMRCATNTTLFSIAATSGATVNFNIQSGGYIFNPQWITASSSSTKGVTITGNCAVNFNSNIWGSTGAFFLDTTGAQIYIGAAATVTINGNVYAPLGAGSSGNYFQIHMPATLSNSAILNINGDILASNGSNLVYPIWNLSNSTINITGNLTSNISQCIQSTSAAINVIGNIGMTLGSSLVAISSGGSTLTMNGSITNKGNKMAVFVPFLRFAATATPYWIFQNTNNADITLSYGTATGPYPAEADVRYNTAYGASPTRYGTLRVPLPQYVSQGVLTDNTIGTAYLNAADVWNILTSTITVSGSIGERLKNASTVQTTGDQIASYQV